MDQRHTLRSLIRNEVFLLCGYPLEEEVVFSLVAFLLNKGFPGGSDNIESACNAGDLGSVPGLGRSPGEEHGKPL